MSFIHKFKNRASWKSLGLEGSTVSERTRCGGLTFPTLLTSEIAPVCKRSTRVRLTKSARGLHDKLFLKCSEGGRSELYCFPFKIARRRLKILKNWHFILYPFQNLSLLRRRRITRNLPPLITIFMDFSSTETARVSKT